MAKASMGRAFGFLWMSESAFDLGAAILGFSLGVWVFERTNSAEQFSYTILSVVIPSLLISPLAGVLADRFDRRFVIASCDLIVALMVGALALLLFYASLDLKHLYIFNIFASIAGTIRNPAYQAAVSVIVPKEQLTQASGIVHASAGLFQILAPLVGGYLMAAAGLRGVMLVELILVVAGALAVFTAFSFARHAIRGIEEAVPQSIFLSVKQSLKSAVAYFTSHHLMAALVTYVVLQEGLLVLISSMITPLILATHSSDDLGVVMTIGAIGGMAGSIAVAAMNINRNLMVMVLIFDGILSIFVALAGFTTSTILWSVCAFFAMAAGGVSGACAGALWMRKIPKAKQGSVFSFIGALHSATLCCVIFLGAKIGDHIFEPALAVGGNWAGGIGEYIGVGKGRGYALLFAISGTACTLFSLIALAHPRLRRLDNLVSDADEITNQNDLTNKGAETQRRESGVDSLVINRGRYEPF